VRRLLFMVENMKTLAELAEKYLAQADHLKSELNKIPKNTDNYKLKYKRAVFENMYNEAMSNYNQLNNYYKK
jgi:hypothetical protein